MEFTDLINELTEVANTFGFVIGYLEAAEETTNPKLSVALDMLRSQGKFPKKGEKLGKYV